MEAGQTRTGRMRVGTAGWAIPRRSAEQFPAGGTTLERYALRFHCTEINTSFYRPHRPETYARWAAAVPSDFRFAVKMPRQVTHERRLVGAAALVDAFLAETAWLGEKRGPILVQLPPSLAFDAKVAAGFFTALRAVTEAPVACEPRHASWFADAAAEALLVANRIARVAADPAPVPAAAVAGGWPGVAYWRLHGSPRTYFSAYDQDRLAGFAAAIARCPAPERWCILDNTGGGAAAGDALALSAMLGVGR
jgi:uncharacterized protein YecE (DUF72 family)